METSIDLREKKCDFNQNIIESSCAFEQLCNTINELQKVSNVEKAECNRADTCPNRDIVLEPILCKRSEQVEPEKDNARDKCGPIATTYEDIMSLLKYFEYEDTRTDNVIVNGTITSASCRNLSRCNAEDSGISNSYRDDLETAKLQIQEKNATVECLKDQLKSERKAACDKIISQKRAFASKMKELENKYKTMVKRHQKFIEQLIAEKSDLTQKCDRLALQIKEMEMKVQRDFKTLTERHSVELQRAKDNMAASEKIRRERWLELKTSKIKEMTVKGLEPELHNMMEQHQLEIQELRRAHIKDLQDMELRAMRRSNNQLEQLRIELTDSHEKMLTKEKDILTARYNDKLQEQERHFDMQQKIFSERFEKKKLLLIAEQKKCEEESSAKVQQMQLQFQNEAETLKEQFEIAKKNFEESLRKEWHAWTENYSKLQSANYAKAKDIIRNDYQRERDKQIEIAIARLEKESREMLAKSQQSFDNKLGLMKGEYEKKVQDAMKSESIYKHKLLLLKEKLECTEARFKNTENKLKDCMTNLNNMNQTIAELNVEKDNAKEIARHEIEMEKRVLEDKIASLYQEITQNNADRDQLMAQLHSRVKLIVTQKVVTIKSLNKKLDDANSKCEHLEKLLDQQRREYILKTL